MNSARRPRIRLMRELESMTAKIESDGKRSPIRKLFDEG